MEPAVAIGIGLRGTVPDVGTLQRHTPITPPHSEVSVEGASEF
jgi:hypothetical protein